jgi:hypothetical protein
MRSSIEINRPEALRTADVEDDHALDVPELDHLESIGGSNLPRAGVGLASCVG